MFLEKYEVRRLTGKLHKDKQIAFLKAEGYTYRLDEDGYPVLARAHVEQRFDVKPGKRPRKPVEPNYEGLERKYGARKTEQQTPASAGVLRIGNAPLSSEGRQAN